MLIPGYLRDASIAVITYDITSMRVGTDSCEVILLIILEKETFDSLEEWIKQVKEVRDEETMLFLFGNKLDLEEHR